MYPDDPRDAPWPPPEWGDGSAPLPPAVPDPVADAAIRNAPLVSLLQGRYGAASPEEAAAQDADGYPPADWTQAPAPTGAFTDFHDAEPSAKARKTLDHVRGMPEGAGFAPTPHEVYARGEGGPNLGNAQLEGGDYVNPLFADVAAEHGDLERPGGPEFGDLDPMSEPDEARFTVNRGPEYAATQAITRENERAETERAAALDLARTDAQAAARNLREWGKRRVEIDQKHKQLDNDLVELGEKGVDNNHWMESRTGGQMLAVYISAIAGGQLSLKNGGRNAGLDMIKGAIDADIETQKGNLAHRRGVLSDRAGILDRLTARYQDDYQATEVARAASYQSAMTMIKLEAANYDPRGTAVQNLVDAYTGLDIDRQKALAAAHAALEKREQQGFENELKVTESAQNEEKISLDWAKLAAEKARDRVAAKGKAGAPEFKPEYFPVAYAMPGMTPEQIAALKPLHPMTEKAYQDWQETRSKITTTAKTDEMRVKEARENSPQDRARVLGVAELVRNDGKPILFRNDTVAGKMESDVATVKTTTHLIDRIILARKKYGWSSDLMKSDEWRTIQADFTQLELEKKNTDGLGVIAGPDLQLLGTSAGTMDPTEVRDPTAGLIRARENMINKVNDHASAVDPEAKRWEPPRMKELDEFERPKADDVKIATNPIATNPNLPRGELVDERARAIEGLKHKKPTAEDRRAILDSVERDRAAGLLSDAEAGRLIRSATTLYETVENEKPAGLDLSVFGAGAAGMPRPESPRPPTVARPYKLADEAE